MAVLAPYVAGCLSGMARGPGPTQPEGPGGMFNGTSPAASAVLDAGCAQGTQWQPRAAAAAAGRALSRLTLRARVRMPIDFQVEARQ